MTGSSREVLLSINSIPTFYASILTQKEIWRKSAMLKSAFQENVALRRSGFIMYIFLDILVGAK
jgi:hypothetical protein